MYIKSFIDFIFENSSKNPIVDFCLDIFNEYRAVGKEFLDLPLEVQQCIKSNGQTDISRKLEKIYNQYVSDGESFSSFPNIVGALSSLEESNPVEILGEEIVQKRGEIQFSFVPIGVVYNLVITGKIEDVEDIHYTVSEIFQEGEKLVSYRGNREYDWSELIIELDEDEADFLKDYIYNKN
jgi:hypothetical protein